MTKTHRVVTIDEILANYFQGYDSWGEGVKNDIKSSIFKIVLEALPEKNNRDNCHESCAKKRRDGFMCYHEVEDKTLDDVRQRIMEVLK